MGNNCRPILNIKATILRKVLRRHRKNEAKNWYEVFIVDPTKRHCSSKISLRSGSDQRHCLPWRC